MTNNASQFAVDEQTNYTSLIATPTQAPLQQMNSSAFSTSTTESMMAEPNPSTSPLSAAPKSPPLSTKLGRQEIKSETNSSRPSTASTELSPKDPPITLLKMPDESVSKVSFKRCRGGDDDKEDGEPFLKKLSVEAKMRNDVADQTIQIGPSSLRETPQGENMDNIEDFTELKKPERQTKPTLEPIANKPAAKSSRGRACAECRRRKVKCKHNTIEDDVRREGDKVGATVPQALAAVQTEKQVDEMDNTAAPIEAEPPKKANTRKKSAPQKVTAPPERTSTRNRKVPDRFENLQERTIPKVFPTKKGSSKVFDPVYITTNSTSRLGKADMYHMLVDDDSAWTSLSADQQAQLVAMLPDTTETRHLLAVIQAGETEDTRPQYLKASDVFRTEVAKFQADLTNGHLAKTWQAAAEQAVAERAAGECDAWKADEAELWWGQKSK